MFGAPVSHRPFQAFLCSVEASANENAILGAASHLLAGLVGSGASDSSAGHFVRDHDGHGLRHQFADIRRRRRWV